MRFVCISSTAKYLQNISENVFDTPNLVPTRPGSLATLRIVIQTPDKTDSSFGLQPRHHIGETLEYNFRKFIFLLGSRGSPRVEFARGIILNVKIKYFQF